MCPQKNRAPKDHRPYFDALGAHPYTFPELPSDMTGGWGQMLQIHDIAAAHGDADKKIWITEFGASTGGPHHVGEELQAEIAIDAIRRFCVSDK